MLGTGKIGAAVAILGGIGILTLIYAANDTGASTTPVQDMPAQPDQGTPAPPKIADIPDADQQGTCKDFIDSVDVGSKIFQNTEFHSTRAYQDAAYDIRYMDDIIKQLNLKSVTMNCPTAYLVKERLNMYYQGCQSSVDGSLDQAAYFYFNMSTMGQGLAYPGCHS